MSRYSLTPLLDALLAFWFQPCCVSCGKFVSRLSICEECGHWAKLTWPGCVTCGQPLSQTLDSCGECRKRKSVLKQWRSLWWLNEHATEIIHHVKYVGNFEFLRVFFSAFERDFFWPFPRDAVVIPIPLHVSRFLKRGFNQSELVARWVTKAAGVEMEAEGLIKVRPTESQSVLSASARLKNLSGSFEWNERREIPTKVVLIDDIYTTGSTFETCGKLLKKYGCEVYGWTLFRTPKRLI